MGVVGTVLTAVSTLATGIASYNAAQSQAEAARVQAESEKQQYLNNAEEARRNAEATSTQGMKEEAQLRAKIRQTQAAQQAAYGASGVSLSSGTPLSVYTGTAAEGQMDINQLRENYQRKKFGYENQAANYEWNATQAERMGNARSSALSAEANGALVGGLLGAASAVSSRWGSWKTGSGTSSGYSNKSMKVATEGGWGGKS